MYPYNSTASLRFVSQKLLSPTAIADVQQQLISLQTQNALASSFADTIAFNNAAVLFGNGISGEAQLSAIGTPQSAGCSWSSTSTMVQMGSMSKLLGGVALARMIEDGYLRSSDLVSTYLPDVMTGSVVYVDQALPGANPYDLPSYTILTGAFDLAAITIDQLVSNHFGAPYGADLFGAAGQQFGLNVTGTVAQATYNGTTYDYNMLYANTLYRDWMVANPTQTPLYLLAFSTGGNTPLKTWVQNTLTNARSGTVPFYYGTNTGIGNRKVYQQPPYYITDDLVSTSINWMILGWAMDRALTSAYATPKGLTTYASLAAYIRTNVFVKLGMNNSFIAGVENSGNLSYPQWSISNWATPQLCRGVTGVIDNVANTTMNFYPSGQFTSKPSLQGQMLYCTGTAPLVDPKAAYPGGYDISDDGLFLVAKNSYTNYTTGDLTNIDTGLVCTLADYSKIIMMIISKGKGQLGLRVLSSQGVNWLLTNRSNFDVLLNTLGSTIPAQQLSFGVGVASRDPLSASEAASSPQLVTNSTYMWSGVYNSGMMFDTNTGYFTVGTSQNAYSSASIVFVNGSSIINVLNLIANDN
jgi:CubicO group peptidase (beta-lactamase class C family)